MMLESSSKGSGEVKTPQERSLRWLSPSLVSVFLEAEPAKGGEGGGWGA